MSNIESQLKVISRSKHLLVPKIVAAIGIFLVLALTCAIASAGLSTAGGAPETKKWIVVSPGVDQSTHHGCLKCSAHSPDSVQNKSVSRDAQVGWERLFNGIAPYGAWKTNPLPGTSFGT